MASKVENRSVNIYINGKQATSTLKEMESHSRQLRNELSRLVPGTEAFKNKITELKSVNRQLNSIKDDIKGVGGAFGWLKTEVGKFGMLAAGYLGFEFVTNQFRNIITQNAKLSDSIADVMKTTGLTETSVRRLNSEFKKIDTRSSREELNGLARVAGKLGISAEQDVLGFVKAADQISVALGEDLGGAEEAINSLGKLVEIFKLKDQFGLEQSLLNVGSAINELGAAGTANEGYIVEFTKRLAGIAPAANISIQDVMGMAAVMDELGQPVEASATAIGQFIVSLGKDLPKFAAIAGMSVQEFGAILQQDGNAALTAVLKNVDSTGEGLAGLAANMGMIGEDGSRAVQALGSLSANLQLLETRQRLANDEFNKGLSLTEEFSVKNNTFGAVLDKLGKKIGSLTSNFAFQDLLMKLTLAFSSMVDWIDQNSSAIVNLVKALTIGGAALLTYRTYLLLANTAMFQFIAGLITGEKMAVLSRTSTVALALAKALLSGNLTKAAQAWRLLNITMAANPFGAVLAGVVAIATALMLFNSRMTMAAQAQKNYNDVASEAEAATIKERLAIDRLMKTLGDETKSKDEKLKAVAELRRMMPAVLQDYKDEEILAGKATGAIREQVKALVAKAKAQAALNKITNLEDEKLTLQKEINDGPGRGEKLLMGLKRLNPFGEDPVSAYFKNRHQRIAEIAALQADLEKTFVNEPAPTVNDYSGGTGTGPGTGTGTDPGAPSKAEEAAAKKAKQLADELIKIKDELFKESLSKDDAEVEAARQKYEKLRADAKGNSDAIVEITNLEAQEVTAILQRQAEARQKLNDEQLRSKEELAQSIFELGLNEENRQLAEADRKYEALVLQAEKLGLDTTGIYRLWEGEKTRIIEEEAAKRLKKQKDTNQEEIDEQIRVAGIKRQIQEDLFNAIHNLISLFVSESGRLTAFQKGVTLAQIAIDTASAISSLMKASEGNPLNLLTGGLAGIAQFAAGVVRITANIAKAKETLSTAKVPAYEQGGYSAVDYSDPKGFVSRPTLFANSSSGQPFIAGENFKTEYIISSEQLKDPVIADFVGMMESRRGVAQFEQGGYSSGASTPRMSGGGSDPVMIELMRQMIAAQLQANDKKVYLPYKDLEDLQHDKATIDYNINA